MTTRTLVIWTDAVKAQVEPIVTAEINVLVQQGKTDGTVQYAAGPGANEGSYIRGWTTLQNAEDWLTFINAMEIPPVSTSILPD